MIDTSRSIAQFLDATAARQPTPGGGAVSALVGALGAALGEMALNYSLGKADLAPFREEYQQALVRMHAARTVLARQIVEDQQAFEALVAAQRLPAETPGRAQKIEQALGAAIAVPQAIAAQGVRVLELCDTLVSLVNRHLLSDLAICADLAMASIRCAVYNIRINLPHVQNTAERLRLEAAVGETLQRAVTLIQSAVPRIWDRHAQGV